MPEDFRAELIEGTVYVASPLGRNHGENTLPLGSLFLLYEVETPGVRAGDNTTVMLGDDSEVQPDLYIRVLREWGGQAAISKDDYIEGAPELVAEVAYSSHSIDVNAKLDDYARHGVREYLVLSLKEKRLRWFDLAENRELTIPADEICRSRTFPGMWIHSGALLKRDGKTLVRWLRKGLRSKEHSAFVKKLSAARRRIQKEKNI
jgi:Uma2 family endonuclease